MFFLLVYAIYTLLIAYAHYGHIHNTKLFIIEVALHSRVVHFLHDKFRVFFVEFKGSLLVFGKEYDSRGAFVETM
jgi:hypothetical protein